jgi:putative acetyltransferase
MNESSPSISQRKPTPTTHPKASVDSLKAISTPPAIEIRSLAPGDDATAFRTLNEEWITRYFTLEAKDRETLNDPIHSILLKGGHIFMAYAAAEAVGCVALIPMRDGIYELSKMAVSPHLRGRGIGRRLLQHAIGQARGLDVKSLFLGSNTHLKDAVHLYESVGFRHVKPESLPPMPYSRADVFMEMPLGWDAHWQRLPPEIADEDFQYSLAMSIGVDGVISDVLMGEIAYQAGFGPGMKILAVNGQPFARATLQQAIDAAKTTPAPIDFKVDNTGVISDLRLDYHGGQRHPVLERVPNHTFCRDCSCSHSDWAQLEPQLLLSAGGWRANRKLFHWDIKPSDAWFQLVSRFRTNRHSKGKQERFVVMGCRMICLRNRNGYIFGAIAVHSSALPCLAKLF